MKDIPKIVHLPSDVQSEFYDATRTLFVRKENKISTLFNFFFSSVTLPASAFLSSLAEHDASTPQMTHDVNAVTCWRRGQRTPRYVDVSRSRRFYVVVYVGLDVSSIIRVKWKLLNRMMSSKFFLFCRNIYFFHLVLPFGSNRRYLHVSRKTN